MVSTSAIIQLLLITVGTIDSKTTLERHLFPWDSIVDRGIVGEKNGSEETLTLFLEELIRQLMITREWHHATILSESKTDFELTRFLCEHRSCFLGRDISEFRASGTFSTKSLVISFLSTYSDGSANGTRLIGAARCFADLTVFVARGFVGERDAIGFFSRASYIRGIVVFANVRGGSTIEYYVPEVIRGCETRLRSIEEDWQPGKKIDLSPSFHRQVLRGCRVRVSTKNEMPAVRVEIVNGRRTIVDGAEGKLMMAFAEKEELRMDVKVVEIEDEEGRSMQDRIVEDVASGVSQIGVGQLRFHAELVSSNVDIAMGRYFDHIVWCVPVGNPDRGKFNLIAGKFSTSTWWIVLFVFVVLVCLSRVFLRCSRRFIDSSRSRGAEIGQRSNEWTKIILEVFSLSLGNPASFYATSTSIRILLSSSFHYATVMTTAYKTSLSSELTATRQVPLIVDPSGIARANLTIGGITTDLRLLKDQIDELPDNAELIRRYVVYANRTNALARLRLNGNFAYIGMLTNVEYERNRMRNRGEMANFDVLPQPVSSFPSLIVFEKDSPFQESFELIVHRLFESGITQYWINEAKNPTRTEEDGHSSNSSDPQHRCVAEFEFVFLLHTIICVLVCPLVLAAELIVRKFHRSRPVERRMLRK